MGCVPTGPPLPANSAIPLCWVAGACAPGLSVLLALRWRPSAQGRRTGGQAQPALGTPTTSQASLPGVRAPHPRSLSFLICGLRKTQPPRHEAKGWPEELTYSADPSVEHGSSWGLCIPATARLPCPSCCSVPLLFALRPQPILLLLFTQGSWCISFRKALWRSGRPQQGG